MQSTAKTVKAYLDELSPERREAIQSVRKVILKKLPQGFEEVMNWGMITYQVPLQMYPNTYNGKPLMYAALASQKNHMSVYLSNIYTDAEKREAFESDYLKTGKRFDAGKSCVRFRKPDDLPLGLIGDVIASTSLEEFIEIAKNARSTYKKKKE